MGFAARYILPCLYFNNCITHQATPFDKCFAGRAYFRFSYFTFHLRPVDISSPGNVDVSTKGDFNVTVLI